MKIAHNSNNNWKEEAKMLGLDEDLYPWIQDIIEDYQNKVVQKCVSLLEENLKTEQYFGVFGSVNLKQFEEDLKL